jgi:DNA-binding beta-propeller fold protein YncE
MADPISKLDANQVLRQSYDDTNQRLRVGAEVSATISEMEVIIDAAGGDNIAITDATGTNYLTPNPDGSINVKVDDIALDQATDSIAIGDGTNLISVDPATGAVLVTLENTNITTKNIFNEITSVGTGITSTIASYVAPANTKLLKVDVGGTNIAAYEILIGGVLSAKKYTFYQTLNETFDFKDGLPITAGDTILVRVTHQRPDLGDFNTNILVEN